MTRTPRSWGLLALVAATVLTPVSIANAAPPNAPAANYLGDTVPANLGDASPMFVGGQNATVSEFPGIIAGIRAGGTRPEGQTCSGTVVAPRKILIAAHCADAQGEKKFVYGLDDLKDFKGGAGTGFAVNVVSYKKHPKYVNFDQGYDVAVVTVDRDIALKGGAAYPKFATSADSGGAAPGKTGLGFGYGKKDFNDNSADVTLDKASLPVVNGDSVCQGVGAGFKSAYMICAGYSDGRITILPGDSGGPLVFDGKIYGVASWSRSDFKWYSVYGRLDNEMGDWVKTEVGEQPPVGDFGLTVAPGSGSVAVEQDGVRGHHHHGRAGWSGERHAVRVRPAQRREGGLPADVGDHRQLGQGHVRREHLGAERHLRGLDHRHHVERQDSVRQVLADRHRWWRPAAGRLHAGSLAEQCEGGQGEVRLHHHFH